VVHQSFAGIREYQFHKTACDDRKSILEPPLHIGYYRAVRGLLIFFAINVADHGTHRREKKDNDFSHRLVIIPGIINLSAVFNREDSSGFFRPKLFSLEKKEFHCFFGF